MINMRIPERSQQTVVEVLARTVAARADKPFLLSGDDVTTFGELDQWSNRLAHALGTTALHAGTPVLLMLNDNVDFIAIWVAISKLAAIEVPINRAYHGMMLTHVINDSGAKLIITERSIFTDRECFAKVGITVPAELLALLDGAGVGGATVRVHARE